MPKKKATNRLSPGTNIRVKAGVCVPEFPEIPCEGWSGRIVELTGKKSNPKYVIEWDEQTLHSLPASYVDECEQKGLFYRMACFKGDEIEAV